LNFEDLHNELNSFPAELNYTDARWLEALKVIKAHERKQAAKKWGFISLCALLISFGGYSALQRETNQLSDYQPRSQYDSENLSLIFEYQSSPTFDSESEVFSEKFTKNNNQTKNLSSPEISINDSKQLNQKRAENSGHLEQQKTNIAEPKMDDFSQKSKVDKDHSLDLAESQIDRSTVEGQQASAPNNSTTIGDKVIVKDPFNMLTDNIIHPKAESTDYDGNTRIEIDPSEQKGEVDTNQIPDFMRSKFPNLKLTAPSNFLAGTKQDVQSKKRYSMPLKFVGIKVGVIPLAEFGRTDNYFKTEFSAGALVQLPITESLGFNFGLDYLEISGMETPLSSTHTSFGFGFENHITSVHTSKIQFLSAPLNLTYQVSSRFQLEAGLGADYILNSKNTLEQHLQSNSKFETVSSEQTSGYFASYNRILINSNLGINYWLTSKLKFGFNYQLGLSDLTQNTAFNSEQKDRNSRLNITLTKVLR